VKPDARVVRQVASWCLSYPDRMLVSRVSSLRAALDEQPDGPATDSLRRFLDRTGRWAPGEWQRTYVDTFDLSRKHALYLSYWTDGDTRRRGEVLGAFKRRYRDSGFLVDLRGELPDFLPMVLEFAALVDPAAGTELLQANRPGLELLRLALFEVDSPYVDVLAAVCTTLPGASPADRTAVTRMAGSGPPTESVGLDPYDPRLLPMVDPVPTPLMGGH
jgi:nitrate reductase delta subunit